ncbi:MAG: serine/threonine protein kinase [Candidatus Melainabacteria bacterium]|nr:serine/threonine protein kinase [Candidatus Melainabacteria bacterium]
MDKDPILPEMMEEDEDSTDFDSLQDSAPVPSPVRPAYSAGGGSSYRRRSLMGQTLAGRFEIIDFLGEGEITEVYSALDNETRQQIAAKVLKDERHDAQMRFREAAESARKLEHDNIARIVDVCESEDGKFVVMLEFLRAANLRELLNTVGPLDEEDTYTVLRDICGALEYAHSCGCVHGGLRPTNVLLTQDDDDVQIKVLDFAIGMPEGVFIDAVGPSIREFISPEQIRKEQVTFNSDVFSLGVIAYLLVTGRSPEWSKGKDEDVRLVPISTLRSDFALIEQFGQLIEDALDRDSDWRLPSATAFLEGLDKWYQKTSEEPISEESIARSMEEPGTSEEAFDRPLEGLAGSESAIEPVPGAIETAEAVAEDLSEESALEPDEAETSGDAEPRQERQEAEMAMGVDADRELARPQPPPPPPREATEDEAAPKGRRRRAAKTMKLKTTVRNLVALRQNQSETESTLAMQFTGHFATAGPRQSPTATIGKLVGLSLVAVATVGLAIFNFDSLKEAWHLGSKQLAHTFLKPADKDSAEAALKDDDIPVSSESPANEGKKKKDSDEPDIIMAEAAPPADPNAPPAARRKYRLKEIEKRAALGSEYYSRYSPKASWKGDPVVGNRRRIDYREFRDEWKK